MYNPTQTKIQATVVLQNLLNNAVKFTEQGVTMDVHPSDEGIEFCVADTGIRIASEVRPVIFEEMQRSGQPQRGKLHVRPRRP
jgi:signal transduction histidine kinase